MEFENGSVVTLDRYNRKYLTSKGVVVNHEIISDNRVLYHIRLSCSTLIKTTGLCIVESKFYEPSPDGENLGFFVPHNGYFDAAKEIAEDQAWFERRKNKFVH